jgi:hypothetical protein
MRQPNLEKFVDKQVIHKWAGQTVIYYEYTMQSRPTEFGLGVVVLYKRWTFDSIAIDLTRK